MEVCMISKKKITLTVFLMVFLAFSAQASMVSFYIIETGLSDNGKENEYSVLWENAFLDVFFDGGFIVSNAPILRLEEKPEGDILRQINMHQVRNAGIDFLIIAQLDFHEELIPSEITFYIYKVTPRELILERKIERRQSRASREEYEYLKSIARGLIPYID